MWKFMLIGILLGCGDSQGAAVDAGQGDARTNELVGLIGNGDVAQLARQDASADAAELESVDAAQLESVDAAELVDAAQVDAGTDAAPNLGGLRGDTGPPIQCGSKLCAGECPWLGPANCCANANTSTCGATFAPTTASCSPCP